jgi:hypothetical protein
MIESQNSWEVTLLRWDVFLKIMIERGGNSSWKLLWEHTDVIVGGLNFEGDFLYVVLI